MTKHAHTIGIIEMNPGELPVKDLDRLIFAIQGRNQKLTVVNKPMTRDQCAAYLNVCVATVDRLTKQGKLPFHRIEGLKTPFYLPEEIYHLIKNS